jgi:hypothetical protein
LVRQVHLHRQGRFKIPECQYHTILVCLVVAGRGLETDELTALLVLMGVPILGLDLEMNLHDILHDKKKSQDCELPTSPAGSSVFRGSSTA